MMEWWNIGRMGSKEKRRMLSKLITQYSIIPIFHFTQAENKLEAMLNHWDVE
jgi:hypothetical protein